MKTGERHVVRIVKGFASGKTAHATWDAEQACYWAYICGSLIGFPADFVSVVQ